VVDTGVSVDALVAGFTLAWLTALVVGLPYMAVVLFRVFVDV
jgi:hypothetical protein